MKYILIKILDYIIRRRVGGYGKGGNRYNYIIECSCNRQPIRNSVFTDIQVNDCEFDLIAYEMRKHDSQYCIDTRCYVQCMEFVNQAIKNAKKRYECARNDFKKSDNK
jgi:hypothetical protein